MSSDYIIGVCVCVQHVCVYVCTCMCALDLKRQVLKSCTRWQICKNKFNLISNTQEGAQGVKCVKLELEQFGFRVKLNVHINSCKILKYCSVSSGLQTRHGCNIHRV